MAWKTKGLFVLVLVVFLSVAMSGYQVVKQSSIRELYEDVTIMRIATEAKQYISQIEYGIKNGRQLENFFNMQETLQGVLGCSSYMEGAYVVSSEAKLLYQRGIPADSLHLQVPQEPVDRSENLYTVTEDGQYFYLASPIEDSRGKIEGYLIMCIGQHAVTNAVSDYNRQNQIQSIIIALEVLGAAVLLITRVKPKGGKSLARRLMLITCLLVTTSVIVDATMVCTRFYYVVEDTTTKTANKMAQALQSQVDSVVDKGVPMARIYDLNSWLAQNTSELEIVTSLNLDQNNKITAKVSQDYINGFLYLMVSNSIIYILLTLVGGLIAWGSFGLLREKNKGWGSFSKKKKGMEYGI